MNQFEEISFFSQRGSKVLKSFPLQYPVQPRDVAEASIILNEPSMNISILPQEINSQGQQKKQQQYLIQNLHKFEGRTESQTQNQDRLPKKLLKYSYFADLFQEFKSQPKINNFRQFFQSLVQSDFFNNSVCLYIVFQLLFLPIYIVRDTFNVFIGITIILQFIMLALRIICQKFCKLSKNENMSVLIILNICQIIGLSIICTIDDDLIQWISFLIIALIYIHQLQYNLKSLELQLGWPILVVLIELIIILNLSTNIWINQIIEYQDYLNNDNYLDQMTIIISIYTFHGYYVPQTQAEKIAINIMSILSIILLAQICKQLSSNPTNLRKYFKQNNIPYQMQKQLRELILREQNNQEQKMFKLMPHNLVERINEINKFEIVKQNFSQYNKQLIQKVAEISEIIHTKHNEQIVQVSTPDDCSLYIIISGQYSILTKTGQILGLANNQFGEISFYTQQPRSATVISNGEGRLLKIRRNEFKSQLNQKDLQLFQMRVDQMQFNHNISFACLLCQLQHPILRCPLLNYQPSIAQLIQSPSQERCKFNRHRNYKDLKALIFNQMVPQYGGELVKLYSESGIMSEQFMPYEDDRSPKSKMTSIHDWSQISQNDSSQLEFDQFSYMQESSRNPTVQIETKQLKKTSIDHLDDNQILKKSSKFSDLKQIFLLDSPFNNGNELMKVPSVSETRIRNISRIKQKSNTAKQSTKFSFFIPHAHQSVTITNITSQLDSFQEFMDFDVAKSYDLYYPHDNLDSILGQITQYQ